MTELIIHIDAEKEPLIAELVKQLGGSVLANKHRNQKKSSFKKELKQAVAEINDIKAGKKTARDAEDFLNELHS